MLSVTVMNYGEGLWRREPESNRPKRICNPLHNRFAIAPCPPLRIKQRPLKNKGKPRSFPGNVERETRFELATSTLARLRSTS